MRFITILICVLALSPNAFADKPVITAITGVSNANLTGTITAYGGFAGTACTGVDINTPCDNCAAGALLACNTLRAYNGLLFRVTATKTDAGNLIIVKTSDNTAISVSPHNSSNVSAPWSAICAGLGTGGISDCETTTVRDGSVKICNDKNLNNSFDTGEECEDLKVKIHRMEPGTYDTATATDGITDFVPYPGDEKIYIEDPLTSANFPNLSHGGKIAGVRVFIGEGNMTAAVPGSGLEPVDLAVVEDGSFLSDSKVDGLTNGTKYWFRLGLRDEANNIGYFWPPAAHVDVNGANCDTSDCVYTATPDEVVGLLTEDVNCFIATAAYGTSFNDKLATFREFRFKRLLPHAWGRSLVKAYYHYGPIGARYIHDKPILRTATRLALWPAYGFSYLALRFGLGPAALLSLFAMTTLIALPLFGVRRFFSRA